MEWNYSVGCTCKTATMREIPPQPAEDRRTKDTSWRSKASSDGAGFGWRRVYLLLLLLWVCDSPKPSLSASVAEPQVKHEGFCPNKLNANLWVDAQSTCERECDVDEVTSFICFISLVEDDRTKFCFC